MEKEIQEYVSLLNEIRTQIKNLLDGLPQEALDWRPLAGEGDLATNSLTVIVAHLAGSEMYWMKEIIGGRKIQRDREAEFVTTGLTVAELKNRLDEAGKVTQEILSSLKLPELEETRKSRDRTVNIRWGILHVIEHYGTHLGHVQLTRQLWLAKGSGK